MTTLRTTATILAILAFAPLGHAQSDLTDRLSAAIETVERACANDIQTFCSKVTRGEGRLILCMQAHEDQLSRRCNFTLYRVSRHLERALNRVERTAEACWSDIEARCGDAESVGQCLLQKRGSFAPACQTTLDALQQAVRGVMSLRGRPVYSEDDKSVGQVVTVTRGPDDKITSIDVEVGRFLGLGSKVVTIDADKLADIGERIRLRVRGDQLRAFPEAVPNQQ